MAKEQITTNGTGGKGISKEDRKCIEIARKVQKRVLDPLMLFTELLRGYDEMEFTQEKVAINTSEICDALRLLVIGGYTELNSHCTGNGGEYCMTSGYLKIIIEEWAQNIAEMDKE